MTTSEIVLKIIRTKKFAKKKRYENLIKYN